MVLEQEIEYFEANRAGLLEAHKGKFALIKGSALWGIYETADEACEDGWRRFGRVPFLVAPITETFLVTEWPMAPYEGPETCL